MGKTFLISSNNFTMKKIITSLAILFFILPSVSSAAALTQQQANSLIAVVQSSPGTPASAFVSLITAFSNITTTQASSLITVVQAAPSVPANAFVGLLTSFTVDTSTTQAVVAQTTTQTSTTETVVPQPTNTVSNTPTTAPTTAQNPTPIPTPTPASQPTVSAPIFVSGPTPVVIMDENGNYTIEKINWQTKESATMVWWPTATKNTTNLNWLCDGNDQKLLNSSGKLKARTTYNCMFRVANSAGITTDAPFTLTTGPGTLIVQELENRSGYGLTRSFTLNDTVPLTIKKIAFDVAWFPNVVTLKFNSLSLECEGSRWNLCSQQQFTVSGPFSFTLSPENITTYSQKIEIPVNITLTNPGDRVTFTAPTFSGLGQIRWYTPELDRTDISISGGTFVSN